MAEPFDKERLRKGLANDVREARRLAHEANEIRKSQDYVRGRQSVWRELLQEQEVPLEEFKGDEKLVKRSPSKNDVKYRSLRALLARGGRMARRLDVVEEAGVDRKPFNTWLGIWEAEGIIERTRDTVQLTKWGIQFAAAAIKELDNQC